MSRRDVMVRLRHMLDHAREAAEMTRGKTRADLAANRKLNLALVRLLEIVGEAASRMAPAECAVYPDIPWLEIVSLRNRLIHGYDNVDFDILWQIVTRDLPQDILRGERRAGKSKTDAEMAEFVRQVRNDESTPARVRDVQPPVAISDSMHWRKRLIPSIVEWRAQAAPSYACAVCSDASGQTACFSRVCG
jgi:uncharacterized protein with HEPN domain